MSKYILKFEKDDSVKFVSHLDLIRVFDRAMRRAKLPMGYSQGVNPHPLMTFAHPLGVGVASCAELVEMTTSEQVEPLVLKEGLNAVMPSGFEITAVKEIEGKNNFARLNSADYAIRIEGELPDGSLERHFRGLAEIKVDKKTKSGVKETDIKPFILRFKEVAPGMLNVRLKTGAENLKPELLITGLEKYIPGFKPERVLILRTCLLDGEGEPLFQEEK